MKKHVKLLLSSVLMTVALVSCDLLSELNSSSKMTFKVTNSTQTNLNDTVLFTAYEIKSFCDSTGEIIFTDSLVPKKLKSYRLIKCYLGNDSLFTAKITSNIMSYLINDLVLNRNPNDGEYCFKDGYPDFINNTESNTLRAQNKQKRAASWAKFINKLQMEGKYIK